MKSIIEKIEYDKILYVMCNRKLLWVLKLIFLFHIVIKLTKYFLEYFVISPLKKIFFWPCLLHAEVLGQGLNLHHSCNQSYSSDNAGCLTC